MKSVEVNYPSIIKKPRSHAAVMGWLATVALLGLMLWLSPAAPVSAQSLTGVPTSPCQFGGRVVLDGWTRVITPDCSDSSRWPHGLFDGSQEIRSWSLGNVPPTPGGHTTFVTLRAEDGQCCAPEGIATTINGLQAGRTYDFSMFFNANYVVGSLGNNYGQTCPVTVSIDGVAMSTPGGEGAGNTWVERRFSFVATGTTATLAIQTQVHPNLMSGCLLNIYVPANAVVAAVVDADLQMTKTVSPTGAVASGSVLTYTLTARNNGPAATTNAVLRDTPSQTGLDCLTPSPVASCSASGGATCPSTTVPVTTVGSGLTLPNMPVGGQVTVTFQCTVTATGR
jgi:uncharacterized repeat protein (TIGR01451 family)